VASFGETAYSFDFDVKMMLVLEASNIDGGGL
jgi:hypothetical protein